MAENSGDYKAPPQEEKVPVAVGTYLVISADGDIVSRYSGRAADAAMQALGGQVVIPDDGADMRAHKYRSVAGEWVREAKPVKPLSRKEKRTAARRRTMPDQIQLEAIVDAMRELKKQGISLGVKMDAIIAADDEVRKIV